ncbi:hypothetical protein HK104_002848, partial [Borealophlyctis nickersoniae]
MEPAWRSWGSSGASDHETLVSARRDMAFTIAYDCFFGVGGRVVVLRQPTFVGFAMSLVGNAMFELVLGWWEAERFRRRVDKVKPQVVLGVVDKTDDVDTNFLVKEVAPEGSDKGTQPWHADPTHLINGKMFDTSKHGCVAPLPRLRLPPYGDGFDVQSVLSSPSPIRHTSGDIDDIGDDTLSRTDPSMIRNSVPVESPTPSSKARLSVAPAPPPPGDVEMQVQDIPHDKVDESGSATVVTSETNLNLSRKAWGAHRLATTA